MDGNPALVVGEALRDCTKGDVPRSSIVPSGLPTSTCSDPEGNAKGSVGEPGRPRSVLATKGRNGSRR